jgi:hypothetical protein
MFIVKTMPKCTVKEIWLKTIKQQVIRVVSSVLQFQGSRICRALFPSAGMREMEIALTCMGCVQDILVEVDTQVAEKEKEDRKLEIYNRIEAKSFTVHRGHKFKKSDILSKNRRLRSVVRDSNARIAEPVCLMCKLLLGTVFSLADADRMFGLAPDSRQHGITCH